MAYEWPMRGTMMMRKSRDELALEAVVMETLTCYIVSAAPVTRLPHQANHADEGDVSGFSCCTGPIAPLSLYCKQQDDGNRRDGDDTWRR